MGKNIFQPAKNLQARNGNKHNHSGKKRHNTQLINLVPLKDGNEYNFKTQENEFKLAEMMIRFAERKFKKDLNKIDFDFKKDSLSSIINKCNELVISKNMQFSIPQESKELDYIQVSSEVPFKHYTWFLLEMKNILTLPEELKPAFAFICNEISKSIEREELDYFHWIYKDLQDSPIIDYDYLFEDEEEKERLYETKKYIESYREKISDIKKYLVFDIDVSRNFVPRTEKEKLLKNVLIKGVDLINFHSFNYFAESIEYNEDLIAYNHCVMLLWDINGLIERELMDTYNEYASNGQNTPMAVTTITEKQIKRTTTKKEIKEFQDLQDYFFELNDAFNL